MQSFMCLSDFHGVKIYKSDPRKAFPPNTLFGRFVNYYHKTKFLRS